MGDNLVSSAVTVMLAIVGLAIVATLVSKQANTTGVITAGGNAFSGALAVAEGPVTGYNYNSAGTFNGAGIMD